MECPYRLMNRKYVLDLTQYDLVVHQVGLQNRNIWDLLPFPQKTQTDHLVHEYIDSCYVLHYRLQIPVIIEEHS